MAWGRYYKYGYGKRYGYGAKKRSVKAITQSRSFKASASNMTQNGVFNISVRDVITLQVATGATTKIGLFDVAAKIASADMHTQLSNVFDEYKIEKVSLKLSPSGHTTLSFLNDYTASYIEFFTCIDRTGFAAIDAGEGTDLTVEKVRTYQSFKSVNWPTNGDTASKMFVNIGQSDIVNKSKYYDTKGKAVIPQLVAGIALPAQVAEQATTFNFNIEIDAQVRYRGVRYDNRNVNVD